MAHKERVPLGCLLGQPSDKITQSQLKRVSKETGLSIKKIRAALNGDPNGLTFQELEMIRETLRKEE